MMRRLARLMIPLLLGCVLLVPAAICDACTRAYPFTFEELFEAEIIVRVTAVKYRVKPEPGFDGTETRSTIEFKVEEWLHGGIVDAKTQQYATTIVHNGYLSDKDDYNDSPAPYDYVRPEGRSGSCFANTYKKGAQFLLFLKRGENFGLRSIGDVSPYTPYWNALGPTNEQVRSANDPWVWWVKGYLAAKNKTTDNRK